MRNVDMMPMTRSPSSHTSVAMPMGPSMIVPSGYGQAEIVLWTEPDANIEVQKSSDFDQPQQSPHGLYTTFRG